MRMPTSMSVVTFTISSFALTITSPNQLQAQSVLGPEWVEGSVDAGSLPNTAQVVTGAGSLGRITGGLGGPALVGNGDFEDMYRIRINTPTLFSIRTDSNPTFGFGGGANFDTQLWVFDVSGLGILGNDDANDNTTGSAVFQFSDDGSEAGIFEPGEYFICISGSNNIPLAAPIGIAGLPGLPIYAFETPFEVSGPDGPGGDFPIDLWSGQGAFGTYSIDLTGTGFIVPTPGALMLLGLSALLGRRRRS